MAWSVQGIRYLPQLWEEWRDATTAPLKVCKVVSQGLACSPPEKVSKVVFLTRNPFSVAKSQEKLSGRFPNDEAPKRDGKEVKIRSVQMYNQVTIQAAQWFVRHPEVEVLVVEHEDLVTKPAETIATIAAFVGEGDWDAAASKVDPKLKRSAPVAETGALWTLAQDLYAKVSTGDWAGVVQTAKDFSVPEEERKSPPVMCTRLGRRVVEADCTACKTHTVTLVNFIQNSQKRGIDWANEPCIRDVVDGKHTPEESVANNHWLTVT